MIQTPKQRLLWQLFRPENPTRNLLLRKPRARFSNVSLTKTALNSWSVQHRRSNQKRMDMLIHVDQRLRDGKGVRFSCQTGHHSIVSTSVALTGAERQFTTRTATLLYFNYTTFALLGVLLQGQRQSFVWSAYVSLFLDLFVKYIISIVYMLLQDRDDHLYDDRRCLYFWGWVFVKYIVSIIHKLLQGQRQPLVYFSCKCLLNILSVLCYVFSGQRQSFVW